jgi:hypothetical protein
MFKIIQTLKKCTLAVAISFAAFSAHAASSTWAFSASVPPLNVMVQNRAITVEPLIQRYPVIVSAPVYVPAQSHIYVQKDCVNQRGDQNCYYQERRHHRHHARGYKHGYGHHKHRHHSYNDNHYRRDTYYQTYSTTYGNKDHHYDNRLYYGY